MCGQGSRNSAGQEQEAEVHGNSQVDYNDDDNGSDGDGNNHDNNNDNSYDNTSPCNNWEQEVKEGHDINYSSSGGGDGPVITCKAWVLSAKQQCTTTC